MSGQTIDAAVLDINLGSGPDYAVAASLADRSVPFVLATGYDEAAIELRFRGVAIMPKPIAKQKLLQAILVLV